VKGLNRAFAVLLPVAAVIGGCEILAGIEDVTYGGDAGSAVTLGDDQASSGSSQGSGDESQPAMTGAPSGSSLSGSSLSGSSLSGSSPSGSSPSGSSLSGSSQGGSSSAQSGGQSGQSGSTTSGSSGQPAMTGQASGSSQTGSAAGAGTGSGQPSGASTSGAQDASADVSRGLCVPGPATGQLPFVVDTTFAPTGAFGDLGTAVTTNVCAVPRASALAKGNCHTTTYTPKVGGFAGIFWQYNFNWGTQGGYPIPPGATKVTFSAKGKVGGEKVTFLAGYTGSATPATPCTDSLRGNTGIVTLTANWTPYIMPIVGGYPGGVLGAFGWVASAPAGAAPPAVTFYVDDVQYLP
jgi:hypothetical protein